MHLCFPLFFCFFMPECTHWERPHAYTFIYSFADWCKKEGNVTHSQLMTCVVFPVLVTLCPHFNLTVCCKKKKIKKKILTHMNEPFMFYVWTRATYKGWLVLFCSCKSFAFCSCKSFASGLRSQPREGFVAKHQPFNLSSDRTQAEGPVSVFW